VAGIRGFFLRFGSLRWFEASVAGVLLGVALAAFLPLKASAQVTVPAGAPVWARTAVNLEYRPIDGVSKIAYVNPGGAGSDENGQVWTFNAATPNYRMNPTGVTPFETAEAAIAAIGTREGPHAVLFCYSQDGVVHTSPVVSGGCRGLSAAHPWYFGPYFAGDIPTSASGGMAVFDPGIGAHPGKSHMFSVQRNGDDAVPPNGGFDNLIIEGFIFRQLHRIWGDPAYDELEAVNGDNDWGPIRVYGKATNVLIRNCIAHSTAGGFDIEGIRNEAGARLTNVVLDRVVALDVWDTNDRYEGVFMAYCDRPRILNSAVVGCGWFRHNPTIDQGNEGTGTNQGIYLSHVKEPWVDNTIAALNSHAGVQARCGGTVTRSLFYANTRNLSFGHGQNELEERRWSYDAVVRDVLVWGSKDIGDESGLALGGGLEWGRCRSADFGRFVIVGDPTYRSTDSTYGLNLGWTPAGYGTTVKIGPGVVYDWNPSGVSNAGAFGWEGVSSTGATVTVTGLRMYENRGKLIYSQGTEATTRTRIQAATLLACRYDMAGTAALYGPSGTTPSKVSGGGVAGYVRRPSWSGGAAPDLWAQLGFANEEAMLAAFAASRGNGGWDAQRVINRVFPEFGFGSVAACNTTAANVAVSEN